MKTYTAKYKCRHCNEIFGGVTTGNKRLADDCVIDIAFGIKSKEAMSPHLFGIQDCKDGSISLGDFIGMVVKDDD